MTNPFATSAQDIVGIYDQDNFDQLFSTARPMKAKINRGSQVMTHPVEDGTTIADHKVISPIEIELSVILGRNDYRSVYSSVAKAFAASTLFAVETRAGVFTNMLIATMPHDESPDMFENIPLVIKFQEVRIVRPASGALVPRNQENSNTKDRGKQNVKPEKKESVLFSIFEKVAG